MTTARVGVVGAGWRAEYYLQLASQLTESFELVGVAARRPEIAQHLRDRWSVPAYHSPRELYRGAAPDLVVVAVPPSSNRSVVEDLTAQGAHVLTETPPSLTVDGLRGFWHGVGAQNLVQVAEQYHLLPGHAARLELVRRGVIGKPTSVEVSSTHTYHAVSLIRRMLGEACGPATIRAYGYGTELLDPLNRAGWVDVDGPQPAQNTIATIDFGDTLGIYDFTDNQWHNRLRHRRIVVRGTHGEIVDDSVVRMTRPRTIVTSRLSRSQLGYDLNLDGYDTEHIHFDGSIVFNNPFLGHRLMDEEIAIASLMVRAADWAMNGEEPPYPLAEALQDQLIGLAIERAAASGQPVRTTTEAWMSLDSPGMQRAMAGD